MPPVVHGTTDWPNNGGDEGWGIIDLATNKLWVPAGVNLHTGGTDYWVPYVVLAAPGPAGPKKVVFREGEGHTDGDGIVSIAAVQTATPADKAGETHYTPLQMKDGRLWVSGVVTSLPALPAGSNRIGKVTIRNAADAADIDPLAEATFTGRFPAAAALSDTGANPTTTRVGADVEWWDGTQWRRARSLAGIGQTDQDKPLAVAHPGFRLNLNSSNLNPTGNDIFTSTGGAVALTTDFSIRDTASHFFLIPMKGWRDCLVSIWVNPAFDQAMTFVAYYGNAGGNNDPVIVQATLTASTAAQWTLANAAGGLASAVGGANIANLAIYAAPIIGAPVDWLTIRLVFGVAPTAGVVQQIYVTRQR